MRPFFQGQLDCFCAAYAVLNAMRLLHALPVSAARQLFNSMLVDLAQDFEHFAEVAFNATDHTAWVIRLLDAQQGGSRAIRSVRPFPPASVPARPRSGKRHRELTLDSGRERISHSPVAPNAVWNALQDWFSGAALLRPRTAILRFHRFLNMSPHPVISHWTTVSRLENGTIQLADASQEPTAIHAIPVGEMVTETAQIDPQHLLMIEPATIFLLERA